MDNSREQACSRIRGKGFMKHFAMTVVSDDQGMLHLAIPAEEPGKKYSIRIQIKPAPFDDWPDGFIERTAGKWIGELERAPQGEYEERIPFDDPQ